MWHVPLPTSLMAMMVVLVCAYVSVAVLVVVVKAAVSVVSHGVPIVVARGVTTIAVLDVGVAVNILVVG